MLTSALGVFLIYVNLMIILTVSKGGLRRIDLGLISCPCNLAICCVDVLSFFLSSVVWMFATGVLNAQVSLVFREEEFGCIPTGKGKGKGEG